MQHPLGFLYLLTLNCVTFFATFPAHASLFLTRQQTLNLSSVLMLTVALEINFSLIKLHVILPNG